MVKIFAVIAMTIFLAKSVFAFEIDFSRRTQHLKEPTVVLPQKSTPDLVSLSHVTENFAASQDIVILNTSNGFIPKSLSLKEGTKYKIHVVNVNEKEKNVSFIMSAFAQHHGTYYGQIKTFEITPTKEGVYTYQCPETALEGRVVVLPHNDRALASEK